MLAAQQLRLMVFRLFRGLSLSISELQQHKEDGLRRFSILAYRFQIPDERKKPAVESRRPVVLLHGCIFESISKDLLTFDGFFLRFLDVRTYHLSFRHHLDIWNLDARV